MEEIRLNKIVSEEGEVAPVFFKLDQVLLVHDNNREDWFNVMTKHSFFIVLKDELCKDFLLNKIRKNKSFIRSYTRFGTYESEQIGVKTSWVNGLKFLIYYHQELPYYERIIDGEKVKIVMAVFQDFKTEIVDN